jgi:hypothetical protein
MDTINARVLQSTDDALRYLKIAKHERQGIIARTNTSLGCPTISVRKTPYIYHFVIYYIE